MNLPNPLQSNIALFQYIFISGIIVLGILQYIKARNGTTVNTSYVVPLGVLCLILGFIGMFQTYREAFQTIEAAGDISPQIISNALGTAFDYPILGLFGLAISYSFKFVNSKMVNITF